MQNRKAIIYVIGFLALISCKKKEVPQPAEPSYYDVNNNTPPIKGGHSYISWFKDDQYSGECQIYYINKPWSFSDEQIEFVTDSQSAILELMNTPAISLPYTYPQMPPQAPNTSYNGPTVSIGISGHWSAGNTDSKNPFYFTIQELDSVAAGVFYGYGLTIVNGVSKQSIIKEGKFYIKLK